ncbi:hypothetical protein PR202_gb17726 [Eleusine coracana subsp. coracana]|uniref:Fe2OG dioxygenase domain-containing protein n=1 Tax=Eleusine coracana subsp. coracana TaxID=191504 RepID=A0AAV5F535_ELECO|nr:hypothetical protein PR202_gb17726 [Eleusine coracana subsp. coracana]
MHECVRDRLLPEMAKALGLDDDYFSNQFGDKADTYARFSYYPPCPRPDLVFGLKPHSDGTFISVLMVDNNVGGLQVLREWCLIMSNGIFKSPVHRVVTNAEKERLSVALFFSVDPEKAHGASTSAGTTRVPRPPMAVDSWRVPTPVQELAAAVEEPPNRYVLREQDRPGSLLAVADMPEPIPVIDLSRLSDDPVEAHKLKSALQSWGLVLVEGYGNDRVLTQDQILDWTDRLHLRVEPEDERNFAFWPKHPEAFRDVLHEYTSETKKIRNIVFEAMAKILELEEDYFVRQISDKAHAFARFNYYPPCPRPDLVNGVRPHSDGGVLTILLVDKEIMNNGIFKSPVHRVVTNAEKERISLAVFYGVDGEKVLEPAAGLLDEKRPAKYRAIEVKDFVAGLHEHFSRGIRFIEALRI